jgi:hypothetical protein
MATQEEIIEAHLCDPIPQIEIYRAAVRIFAGSLIHPNEGFGIDVLRKSALEQAKLLAKEVKGE